MRAMRRWNGWGEEAIEARLPGEAVDFLSKRIGEAAAPKDATLSDVLAGVGPSRSPDHRLVGRDPEARLRASVGQSLEDWLRLRFGRVGAVVDGVAFPETEDEVREALQWALGAGALTIPVGGATPDFETNLKRWRALKAAVNEAIVREGGAISRQHGVGRDHSRDLIAEKCERGRALRAMVEHFDPNGALDSGSVLPERPR